MIARKVGKLIYSEKTRTSNPLNTKGGAVTLVTLNSLAATMVCSIVSENMPLILHLNIYMNAEKEFSAHPQIAGTI